MKTASPLRYPGGKWRITPFFERLLLTNGLGGVDYVEPYAGGASLALSLLIGGHVAHVHLNDLDRAVHAFWRAVLDRSEEFAQLVRTTPITPDEWMRQREIYLDTDSRDILKLGFATFFLNRTNHSGIMNGGMIGGKKQSGVWRLDARFNRDDLVQRILRVASFKDRIFLSNMDALIFLRKIEKNPTKSFIYLDPPYYKKGPCLYLNAYAPDDHAAVGAAVRQLAVPWVVSYDDAPEIREIYKGVKSRRFGLLHTAGVIRQGAEVMYFSGGMRVPRTVASGRP
ncbi:DNA adenine methylase [Schauerella aestuarii]|uniref:DNA adenine methylase n=1 Tax=Schauerella aestuarii TaxID=2511204 RepID=UPI00136BFEF4|nr:DNA adenine methylase [Achromobacter aestuarii]MYZ45186.1 DNA adenine methylase [Achromobacter aestuarii]